VTHSDTTGTNFSGGVGASWNVFWSERVSTELLVAAEQYYENASSTSHNPAGQPVVTLYANRIQTYPIDALAQYHFVNETSWRPYVGAGLRFVPDPGAQFVDTSNRTSFEVNGGVIWNFSPHWALKFDFKQLVHDDSVYDSASKGSFGVSWSH